MKKILTVLWILKNAAEDTVSEKRNLTKCEKESKHSTEKYDPMRFKPSCYAGNYEEIQCMNLIGQCWCSTKDGRFIPGTIFPSDWTTRFLKYQHAADQGVIGTICPSDDDWTSCQIAVLEAELTPAQNPLGIGTHEWVPKCDKKGYCEKRQTKYSIFGLLQSTWCTELNTKDCGPIPGTETSLGEPMKNCPEDDILRGPGPLSYPLAKIFCERAGMYLPQPKNPERNQKLKEYGPSWIDVLPNVSTQSGSYGHWAEQQRTYLTEDGSWEVHLASDVKEFYCIDRKPLKCSQVFELIDESTLNVDMMEDLFQVSYPEQKRYQTADLDDTLDIKRGTRFRYQCPYPEIDASFICVRINTEEEYLVQCQTPKCNKFKRQPIRIEDYNNFNCWIDGISSQE